MKIIYERELRAAGWRIIWVIWFDDFLSYNSSPRSSHIWFSYIHNVIIILSRVYNEPIQRPVPTWLVSSIVRALNRYRRGQGFESRTSLIFLMLSFRNCKSCVYNCDDLLSYNSSPRSSHIYDFHIFITWKGYCRVRVTTKSIWTARSPLRKITEQRKFWIRWSSHLYSLKLILYSKVFVPETGGKTCTICFRSQS